MIDWVAEIGVREEFVWIGLIAGLAYGFTAEQ